MPSPVRGSMLSPLLGAATFSLLGLLLPHSASAEDLLRANFDDKTVDQPIVTGGAAFGEPVQVDSPLVTAVVRAAPLPTPSLEITDQSDFSAAAVIFELLDSTEVATGQLLIAFELWFPELEWFNVNLREQGSAAKNFLTLRFQENGNVMASGQAGSLGVPGTYSTDRRYPVMVLSDLDARTFDLYLDGVLVLDDQAYDIDDRGIGSVHFGIDADLDLEGTLYVDGLLVATDAVLLLDGFESGNVGAWSNVTP